MNRISEWKKRTVACALSAAMILSALPSVPAYAAETGLGQDGESIVNMAGNREMKEYGESLIQGARAYVSTETAEVNAAGTTYYVDSEGGSDENDGTSQETPWKSFAPVNSKTFEPGDQILLKAGSVWESTTLAPRGSGEEGNPIVLGAYGEGEKPQLHGRASVGEVLSIYNQEYWEIRDLEITNTVDGFTGTMNNDNGSKLKDVRGVRIAGQDAGELRGFELHDLYVHDVTGVCGWISGSSDNRPPGILGGQGWDKSKRTGGIVFEIMEPKTTEPTTFHDITIANNVVNNNSFGGIVVKQWKGDDTTGLHWASREEGKNNKENNYYCDNWTPHKNITIRDNYMSQENSDYACNTIYLTSVQGALVEGNISKEAGTCGIEMYYADDVVVQRNEVYKTRVKAGGADSNAIDPDKASTNILIQYNYIHETGDGILLCGFIFGTSVVRYNVIKDAEKRYINPHGDKGVNYVYNNILYNTIEKSSVPFIESSGGNSSYLNKSGNMHYFYNNIFYNAAKTTSAIGIGEGTSTAYDANSYFGKGIKAPVQDENPIFGDPMFMDSAPDTEGDETTGPILALDNLRLRPESPLLDAGIVVDVESDPLIFSIDNADQDFMGEFIQGRPDVGIYEYEGRDGIGILNGYVSDPYGNQIASASVALKDTEYKAVTDEYGFFAITNVVPGTYTAVVSKDIYQAGTMENIEIAEHSVSRVSLMLGESLSDTGTISGKITNSSGPLPGVEVTAAAEEEEYNATTDSSGYYEITNVPIGTGYTVTAAKEGYRNASAEDVKVLPATSVEVNLILSKDIANTTYLLAETFDDYENGDFISGSQGNNTWVVTDLKSKDPSKVSVRIEEEEDGNKYLSMTKKESCELFVYNKNNLDLGGIITIESRVMRTDQSANANQFGMYTFNKGTFLTGTPNKSSGPIATFALSKGNIITHNKKDNSGTVNLAKYTLGGWDIIRNVVNLDTNTFDVYVNDMNVPVLTNQTLRTQGKNIDKFLLFASGSNLGNMMVDYLKVCTGPAMDYDDAGISGIKVNGKAAAKVSDHSYEIKIKPEVTELSVEPAANSIFAKEVSVDGKDAKKVPVTVLVPADGRAITVKVLAEDRTTSETYELNVVREEETSLAYLTSLTVSGVELSPEFDFNTMEYTGAVGAEVDRVTIQYKTVQDTNAVTVRVNGTAADSEDILLKTGENTIEIDVASADGTSYANYVLIITREGNGEKEIDAIAVESLPEKTVYATGETFDPAGMVIGAYAQDNWIRNLAEDEYTVSGVDTLETGTYMAVVTYTDAAGKECEASFKITVYDPEAMEPSDLKVTRLPEQVIYHVDEVFNPENMEVRVRFKATDSNAVPADVRVLEDGDYEAEFDFSEPGETNVVVSYTFIREDGSEKVVKDDFTVTVIDEELKYYVRGIEITRQPKKTVYEIDGVFDAEGMEVRRIMKASTSNAEREYREVIADYEIGEYDFSAAGKKSVKIVYEGTDEEGDTKRFIKNVPVTVTDKEHVLLEDELKQSVDRAAEILASDMADYVTLEEKIEAAAELKGVFADVLGTDSLEVTAEMISQIGEAETLIEKAFPDTVFSISGDGKLIKNMKAAGALLNAPLTGGNQTVALGVAEAAVPMEIPEVKAAVAMEIDLLINGRKVQPVTPLSITMKVPDGIDKGNVILYHVMENGAMEVIKPQIHGEFMSFIVRKFSTFVAANPADAALTKIEITSKPSKLVYEIGETFETAGMVVTAIYEDGTEAVISDYEIQGFDSSSEGIKTITVSYEEMTAQFTVTVNGKAEGDDNKGSHGNHGNGGGNSGSGPKVINSSPDTVSGNWKRDETGWWFETKDGGYVKSDWARIGGKWYYFNEQGYMVTGWIIYNNQWYFMNGDGAMAENAWILDREQWYYLKEGGVMAKDTVIDGKYRVGGDGVWVR